MNQKGSLSIDLLFATFIFLVIMVTTFNLISERFELVDDAKDLAESRSLAETIAGAINQVYAGGNGHTVTLNMPYHLNKISNYKVSVNNSGVMVDLDGRKGLAHIVPDMISNKPKPVNSSTAILKPGYRYVIYNKKDGSGVNWIIIIEL
jgi:hypothetical protein